MIKKSLLSAIISASSQAVAPGPPASAIPLNGLTFWVKADTGLLTVTNKWLDQSGNGFDLTGPGGSGNPTAGTLINGKATADFLTATPSYMTTTAHDSDLVTTTAWSLFVVFKYTGTAGNTGVGLTPGIFIDNGSSSAAWGMWCYDNAGTLTIVGQNSSINSTGAVVATGKVLANPHIAAYIQNGVAGGGNGLSLTIDADSPVTHDGATLSGLTTKTLCVGEAFIPPIASYSFNGAIGEIICYNRAVTAGEQTQIYTYLKNKFGM
jgi:hypothetical protein